MAILRANISGDEHDIQSGNGVGNYEGSQTFMNFGPLTAKNRIRVFTHPLKILRFCNLMATLTAYIFGYRQSDKRRLKTT